MALLVLTALSKKSHARKLAAQIVKADLAACVTIVPSAESVYRWKGKIERSTEFLLLIKTMRAKWNRLESFIQKNHPYEVPECIAFNISAGSKEYLSWLKNP